MSSRRQQIVTAIDARLQTIRKGVAATLASGASYTYQTDLGLRVFEWRTRDLAAGEAWFLTWRDTEAPKEAAETGRHQHALKVELIVVARGDTKVAEVRSALADLAACLGVDPTWGGLARWTDIDADSLLVDRETQTFVGATLDMTVTYRTNLWEA